MIEQRTNDSIATERMTNNKYVLLHVGTKELRSIHRTSLSGGGLDYEEWAVGGRVVALR